MQAPHPPSPQPSLVPFNPRCERMKSSRVASGSTLSSDKRVPFNQNERVEVLKIDFISGVRASAGD